MLNGREQIPIPNGGHPNGSSCIPDMDRNPTACHPAAKADAAPPSSSSDAPNAEHLCRALIESIGENPAREGLVRTPTRFVKAFGELTNGYNTSLADIVNGAIFEESYSEMVLVKDIEFYSLCEHHLLPFFGRAHVAYIPDGKIIGLSKIPRIVQMFARRLQVQERLTDQISQALIDLLKPRGVACMIEGSHMCMMMRGIQTQSGYMITSSVLGEFRDNSATRDEFMKMVSSTRSR